MLVFLKKKLSSRQKQIIRRWFLKPRLFHNCLSLTPLSKYCGFDRGLPVDRYYINQFIQDNQSIIRGNILEFLEPTYSRIRSGDQRSSISIIDIDPMNKEANIHGDIRNLYDVENDFFDCIIATQVLQFIDNVDAAIHEMLRILKPGGVLLITVPCCSRIDPISGVDGDFWRFTKASFSYLFKDHTRHCIDVRNEGNFYSCTSSLAGYSVEDCSIRKLQVKDDSYPLIITCRVVKEC